LLTLESTGRTLGWCAAGAAHGRTTQRKREKMTMAILVTGAGLMSIIAGLGTRSLTLVGAGAVALVIGALLVALHDLRGDD